MTSVFGTARRPAYTVTRTDEQGRPISLDLRAPGGNSVLFTGGPGMGKTLELDRAQQLAQENGWTCVRVKAAPREPLEDRFVRAMNEDLGDLRKRFGHRAARQLKKMLKELIPRNRNRQNGAEVRVSPFVVPAIQFVGKTQWDAGPGGSVGTSINQLADRLGDLAAQKNQPVMLMIDDLDVASDRDLAAVTELSEHLERTGRPIYLIGAGGEMTMSRLMRASGGVSGIATEAARRFDIRECKPLTADELAPAVVEPLRQAGIQYEQEAVTNLVNAAGGSPSRLRDLADSAVQLAQQPDGLTTEVAKTATARVYAQSRVVYQAEWNNCSPAEKDLLAKVSLRGSRGVSMQGEMRKAGEDRWQTVDAARAQLVARGLLRESPNGDRVTVSDPGMRDWVETRIGVSAAQTGIAAAGSQAPVLEQPRGRHAETGKTSPRTVGNTTFTVNR
ncbi:AAA ATPase-like protein [Kribbella amoyensis]|uniref:AAA ATPase-like protein n=1 Tax=Kribbella amoyensis TaxID=996641 RepID=A0A561BP82_9ACTN|nr:AAA family ATPase [Kribbella amoyensis]TWD80675.1 AAA ATPase-like protein [Kribbella amoyensis]